MVARHWEYKISVTPVVKIKAPNMRNGCQRRKSSTLLISILI